MDDNLDSIGTTLARAEERMRSGRHAADRLWPTGFGDLDPVIGGGLRSGGLVLLAGPHGLGKTTFALQVARNIVRAGRPVVYFSFEHEAEDLIQKLLAMEAGEMDGSGRARLTSIREAFEGDDKTSLDERLRVVPGAIQALANVRAYADLLYAHRSTGNRTDLAAIRRQIEKVHQADRAMPLVIVDYLQKVFVPDGPAQESERTTTIVEGLKDLAIEIAAPVLAIVAAEKEALQTGTRMRMQHLRGSSALAYEADVVLMLNNKVDIVARHHLMYDLGNAERFRDWAILGIEKNRFGRDGIELEYRKRFEQGRFDPEGRKVTEQLIDDRVFLE